MMTTTEQTTPHIGQDSLSLALSYAHKGIPVFPLAPGSKKPMPGSQGHHDATTDEATIRRWFADYPGMNWGAQGGVKRINPITDETEHLVWIDVDRKGLKDGLKSLESACAAAGIVPNMKTLMVKTPSGGLHLGFYTEKMLRQTVDALGEGSAVDVRTSQGYVVGPGSVVDGKVYTMLEGFPIAQMDRLADLFPTGTVEARPAARDALPGVDPVRAQERAIAQVIAKPVILQGARNAEAYKAAAEAKDQGCELDQTRAILAEHLKMDPPLDAAELDAVTASAYKTGKNAQGSAAPEAVFAPFITPPDPDAKPHPFAAMNQEFAFIRKGAFILHETQDDQGNFTTDHLSLTEFHAWFANQPIQVGNQKPKPISQHWMEWPSRRQFEGVVFMPKKDAGERFHNLWRGFSVEPAATAEHDAVKAFLEHAKVNVCNGDPALFRWLMGFWAHAIQRPWEKPLVALVFKGGKGVGKNALVERVGYLLGPHHLVADDKRYIFGNFNSHMENCLLLILDEAVWAGSKETEGRLKGLITGTRHLIERKGKEPYSAVNLTRVAILGNETWLVPASQDERRFAVFNVGDGRKQDRQFFESMRLGMEAGGYAHLLRYFLDFNLEGLDVNDAPQTQGLADQKAESLAGPGKWLRGVLSSGEIKTKTGYGNRKWTEDGLTILKVEVHEHYMDRSRKEHGEWKPVAYDQFFKELKDLLPTLKTTRKWVELNGAKSQEYHIWFPPLGLARKAFDKALGGSFNWGEPSEPPNIFG